MALNRQTIRTHLQNFDLRALFVEELGWDHGGVDTVVHVGEQSFALEAVAHKRGMVAYQFVADSDATIPDHATRRKIEKGVSKEVREHIIVYATHDRTEQSWQWVKREPGQPDRHRSESFRPEDTGERLIQKLEHLVFTLDEEEDLTIVDVSGRVRAAFDVEKVTKRFYDRFKKEHEAFLGFIEGIGNLADQEWYASLMLNRMMFIYFIQKRGFLDNNTDYLRDRLEKVRQQHGNGRFNRFYRLFLLRLFHEGLGQPEANRASELASLLGNVPFLNGGLFDVHDLEQDNPEIQIPDEAFERVFDFFDAYTWHLDDRPLRSDNEINPDVLGYIFEKYINQKQMGAYYTKEDITGYISRNTVIPFLFDRAKKACPIAFRAEGGVWALLEDDPDRYFYEAVRHGITYDVHGGDSLAQKQDLPPDVAGGLDDVSKRGGWNEPATDDYALPTETWREHVARRRHYEEVYAKLSAGDVTAINDLITYNLDIEKFCQDVIAGSEGPELVRAFWKAIAGVSILDPTCGSGAFLFAALNILEPIYTACLEAMRGLLDDLQRSKRKHRPEKMGDFRKILQQVESHPSERYFILKSIIINNLYGVDIMEEAVEICKLRLFLKLVAQLDSVEQIEPLPDIDFNIRAGNTLVGFTSLDDVRRAVRGDLFKEQSLPDIEERAKEADRVFRIFQEMQTEQGMDAEAFAREKLVLRGRLDKLRDRLDRYLAGEYGVKDNDEVAYRSWLTGHQPFHWFVEFYGIMQSGGFDVVIGNPPYVSTKKVRKDYNVRNLETRLCSDIYAWVLERSESLLRASGRSGMIVPLSLGFSSDFDVCRRLLYEKYDHNWFSSFGRIPSALFSFDVRVRNIVHLGHGGKSRKTSLAFTTRLHRWFESSRPTLFDAIEYVPFQPAVWKYRIPKLNARSISGIFETNLKRKKAMQSVMSLRPTKHALHFKQTAYNWLAFSRTAPPATMSGRPVNQTGIGEIYFPDDRSCELGLLLANGKLMYIFWLIVGDDFHVTKWNVAEFPCDLNSFSPATVGAIRHEVRKLERAMKSALQFKLNAGRKVGNYNLAKCRHVTDRIDALVAKELGFEEALDDIELYYVQCVKTLF